MIRLLIFLLTHLIDLQPLSEGGQGLRVPSARIFEGASAAVTVGNQPVDSLLTVEVSYENTATANQDADLAYSNIFIPFNFEARTYWQSVSMVVGTVDGEELVGSNGDVIGRLRINLVASNNTVVISSISIQTFGAASNISNQMIRGVWRKLSWIVHYNISSGEILGYFSIGSIPDSIPDGEMFMEWEWGNS